MADIGSGFPPASEGVLFPPDHVFAAFADPADAQRAVEALRQAGWASHDVTLARPEQVLEEEQAKDQSPLVRTLAILRETVGEEGYDAQAYIAHARQGDWILSIKTADREQTDRIRDILVAHHALTIKHVGRWSATNLPSEGRSAAQS
jgi:hypothetical protein